MMRDWWGLMLLILKRVPSYVVNVCMVNIDIAIIINLIVIKMLLFFIYIIDKFWLLSYRIKETIILKKISLFLFLFFLYFLYIHIICIMIILTTF
jgi:hypothetical protein